MLVSNCIETRNFGAVMYIRSKACQSAIVSCCVYITMHVLTCALARPLLTVAHVALAAVAVGGGDAAAIQTQIGEMLTHIDGGAYILRQDWKPNDRTERSNKDILTIKSTMCLTQWKITNNWTCVNLGPVSSIAVAIAVAIAMPIVSRILMTIKHVNSLSTSCEGNSLDAQPPIFI